MTPRRRLQIAGLACIAVAGGAAVWVSVSAPERPVRCWVHVEEDGSWRAYRRPGGDAITDWDVKDVEGLRAGSAPPLRSRVASSKRAVPAFDATTTRIRESRLQIDAVDTTVERLLRRVGVKPRGVRSFLAMPVDFGPSPPGWFEFVALGYLMPEDAVADPALVGTWTATHPSGDVSGYPEVWEFLADGTTRRVAGGEHQSGDFVQDPNGRWGRVGDVVFLERSFQSASGRSFRTDTLVLADDRLSWRDLSGGVGRLTRPR